MMIDKSMTQFKYVWENISDPAIYDAITGNCYFINDEDDIERIVGLLNEQQSIIQELYDMRLMYNAVLFNEWAKTGKYGVYKSKRHDDNELCFDGDWFVVVANLPNGQISNHYHIKHWGLFNIEEKEKMDSFDGHSSFDVLRRLKEAIDDDY